MGLSQEVNEALDLDFLREMLERFDKGRAGDSTEFDMVRQMIVDWIHDLAVREQR